MCVGVVEATCSVMYDLHRVQQGKNKRNFMKINDFICESSETK